MKEPVSPTGRCAAKTRSGSPCSKFPLKGKRRCGLHGGLSTGPKTASGRKKIAAAQYKHGRYVDWRERREREKFYFAEIKRIVALARAAGLYPE